MAVEVEGRWVGAPTLAVSDLDRQSCGTGVTMHHHDSRSVLFSHSPVCLTVCLSVSQSVCLSVKPPV